MPMACPAIYVDATTDMYAGGGQTSVAAIYSVLSHAAGMQSIETKDVYTR